MFSQFVSFFGKKLWDIKLPLLGITILAIFLYVLVNIVEKNPPPTIQEPISEASTLSTEQELALQDDVGEIVLRGDIVVCDTIVDEMYRSVCRNNIALNAARATLDISHCADVDDVLIPRAECEQLVVSIKSQQEESVTVCDEAADDSVAALCRDTFYISLAIKNSDESECDKITGQVSVACHQSYQYLTIVQPDPLQTNCELFTDAALGGDCTILKNHLLIDQPLDQQFCSSFSTEIFKSRCTDVYYNNLSITTSQ